MPDVPLAPQPDEQKCATCGAAWTGAHICPQESSTRRVVNVVLRNTNRWDAFTDDELAIIASDPRGSWTIIDAAELRLQAAGEIERRRA